MSRALERSACKAVFILVHGTFARGARWAKPDSELCQRLDEGLPYSAIFKKFKWSGANSHRARSIAGRRLRTFIARSLRRDADSFHFIIAHSHGGNVALYALRDNIDAQRVTGIICLATPFIVYKPRRWMGSVAKSGHVVGFLLMCLSAPPLIMTAIAILITNALTIGLAISMDVIYLVMVIAVFRLAGLHADIGVHWQDWVIAQQKRLQDDLCLPENVRDKLFAITVTGDEALWWLHRLTRWSEAPFLLSKLAIAIFATGWLAFIPLLFVEKLGELISDEPIGELPLIYLLTGMGLIDTALLVLITLMFLWPFLVRGRSFGFSGESLVDNIVGNITPSRFPPNFAASNWYNCKMSLLKRMRHCRVYEDPCALKTITEWITKTSAHEKSQ